MPSEVDICNLALGYLGDEATVASINPPDGSAQAAHCARFYAMARDTMQELYAWGICTRRAGLSLLAVSAPSQWAYAYAAPPNAVNILGVYAATAMDDVTAAVPGAPWGAINAGEGIYTPQAFQTESLADGTDVIYTNVADAVIHYTVINTDASKFSPLFVEALAWLLASKLAGPLLKGNVGAEAAKRCMDVFNIWVAKAAGSDANDQRMTPAHSTPWLVGR